MTAINHYQLLSFQVDKEHYALDVSSVREVLEYTNLTKIPRMPNYMRGVINIRGNVVPLVDLRSKFDLPYIEPTMDTSIIVVELETDGDMLVVGLISDSVEAVLELAREDILPAPKIGTSIDISLIKGMGKLGDDFLIILNLSQLLTAEEKETLMSPLESA